MAPRVTIFFWWDDAVRYAHMRARATGVRHRVYGGARIGWEVSAR